MTPTKREAAVGLLAFVLLCAAVLSIRNEALERHVRSQKAMANQILELYGDDIVSKLHCQLNPAAGLAREIRSDPDDTAGFERAAQALLDQGEAQHLALIKGTRVERALPEDARGGVEGRNVKDLHYAFALPRLTRGTVVDGPHDFWETGRREFLFLEPLSVDGVYWGEVAAGRDETRVVDALRLDSLARNGYEYELWHVDSQNGAKNVIAVSKADFDFTQGERISFLLPGQWTLTVMPSAGWADKGTRAALDGCALLAVALGLVVIGLLVRLPGRIRSEKGAVCKDAQSGLYNRRGFQRELDRWIQDGKGPFTLLYFVIGNYNQMAQMETEEGRNRYLANVAAGIRGVVLNEHIVGRTGESNFAVAVRDLPSEEETRHLENGISMELTGKYDAGGRKEFLNVGCQHVHYPRDGADGRTLLARVIADYFARVAEESPVRSLTEKCRRLTAGAEDVEFEEYSDPQMLNLSKTLNQYRKKVEQLAYLDQTYRVGNRSKYLRDARMLISYDRKRPFALYGVDLRSFSRYNDLFSVETGDRILHEVAQRLRRLFGEHLYRINGDVFMGLQQGQHDTALTAAAIDETMTSPVVLGDLKLTLEYRCGVCTYPRHGRTPDNLLECVQTALHHAKRLEDRRIVVYDETLSQILRREAHILKRLEDGLAEGSLEVWYQPVMKLRGRTFTSAEALVRLKDGDGAYLSAGQLIAIAEKNRAVERIGAYVLDHVCRFLKEHGQAAKLERIGVNMSAQELMQEDCAERILTRIREAGAAPSMITLEVTETVLFQSFEHACSVLGKLQKEGLHIALDDFGTGYSSLNYLAKLPVDVLKIDRSLVKQILESPKQMAVLKTIVELARINDVRTVVEGVETEEEKIAVEGVGADFIQGFYFAKAMPQEELLRLMAS